MRGAALIRPLRAADGVAVAELVAACWAEYPGIVSADILDERPLLLRFADDVAQAGGAAFAADRDGSGQAGLAGVIGVRPAPHSWEVVRLYVRADARGRGVADALLAAAEGHAIAHGASRFTLHSDTRFTRAHAFYERHGYVREGALRVLQDRSASLEFGYGKPVDGARALDAAAAASAVGALAALLVACVDAGAGLGFLPPLDPGLANRFWRDRARGVAEGTQMVFAGWTGGRLAGAVTVTPSASEMEPDGIWIGKLMVHPAARLRRLASRLLDAAEAAAADMGRIAVTLDCVAGPVERLYAARGYAEVGRIPDGLLLPDRTGRADRVLFFKRLR